MRITKHSEHGLGTWWNVVAEPGELVLSTAFTIGKKKFPEKSNRRPTTLGTITSDGKIRQYSVPRGYKEIAKYKLEDALHQLHQQGSVFNREAIQERKRERREGGTVLRTTNPKFPENRFWEHKDASRWAERVLRLSPNGTMAGWFHDRGTYATKPYSLEYKNEYGNLQMGSLDMWPGSSSSPRATGHRRKPQRLTPVAKIPTYACIIRAIHMRGRDQKEALAELHKRGSWLTPEQRQQAGLPKENSPRTSRHGRRSPAKGCRWEVVVGNVGTVFDGTRESAARQEYKDYVILSKSGNGRAGGESVTLMCDGDIVQEHIGPNDQSDDSPRRHARRAPRPDAIGSLVHKGVQKVARLLRGKGR
jgi:hypothetical protein